MVRRLKNAAFGPLIAALLAAGPLAAHEEAPAGAGPALDEKAALAVSRKAVGNVVGNYRFVDAKGRTVSLAQFRGRPLVVSMIYTSCAHVCPTVTETLARVVHNARSLLPGDGFAVISLGFDTRTDTPDRMRIFGRQHGVTENDWWLLSGREDDVAALARDIGFDHLTQTTVVDADGKVYRQIYGANFDAPKLVEPLKELAYGDRRSDPATLSGWVNRVRLFCTLYDPGKDRYRFDYSIFIGIAIGLGTLGAVAVFLLRHWRRAPAS
jgi:protein SCO1/2